MSEIDLNLMAKSNPPQTISEHTDKLLERATILKEVYKLDEDVYDLLEIACKYHDYGKYNSEFQKRIAAKTKFNPEKEVPHALLSMFFVEGMDTTSEEYAIVMYAIAYHHVMPGQTISDYFKNSNSLIQGFLKGYKHNDVGARLLNKFERISQLKKTILVKGLLHRCDYSASAEIDVEIENKFLSKNLELFLKRLQKKDTSYNWNDMQLFCEEHKDENLIITAPTGYGKTEAGLKWIGNNKGIYILPLRSALNGMYNRMVNDILTEDKENARSVALLHSDNLSYLASYSDNEIDDLKEYAVKAKQWSMPLTVSTPDQLFDFVFKANGYECKLATAAFSKLVIDEIQAYDGVLLAYIIRGIHEIMDLGGKVAIFTATLPPYVMDLLEKKVDIFKENKMFKFTIKDFEKDSIRHRVKAIQKKMSSEDIIEQMNSLDKQNANKILIICNTVENAQKIFEELPKAGNKILSDYEIKILHAKYIIQERRNLETDIMNDGKYECNKKVIWITTQIVEASLDIDFDVLFTELSDICSLFQRFGRCNRKGLKDHSKTNCYVYTEIDPKYLKEKGKRNNTGFIDKCLYTIGRNLICEWDGEMSEKVKSQLIKDNLTYDNMKDSNFIFEFRKAYKDLMDLNPMNKDSDEVKKKFRDISSTTFIPLKIYKRDEQKILTISDKLKELDERLKSNKENNKELREEYIRKQNELMDFTMSIETYHTDKIYFENYVYGGKMQKIPVFNCNYDKSGFSRLKKDDL